MSKWKKDIGYGSHKVVEKTHWEEIIVHCFGSQKRCEKFAKYLSNKRHSSTFYVVKKGSKVE